MKKRTVRRRRPGLLDFVQDEDRVRDFRLADQLKRNGDPLRRPLRRRATEAPIRNGRAGEEDVRHLDVVIEEALEKRYLARARRSDEQR